MRCLARAAALIVAVSCVVTPRPAAAANPRIGFVGVWDRAEPMLDAAAKELGVSAAFWRAADLLASDRSAEQAAAACDLMFVLNLSPEEATPLRDLFKRMSAANAKFLLVPLDSRGSHVELQKAGLLTEDTEVPRYWRANGAVNLRRMLRYASIKYLGGTGDVEPAVVVPDFGYYDPAREESFETFETYRAFKRGLNRWIESGGVAALLIQQSFWVTHDTKVIDAQVFALEKNGINPVVIFADRQEMATGLLAETHPDLIVEDRHGSMWESREVLEQLDAPYLRPISMLGYTIDEWLKDPAGLATRDVGMFMTLQESWGTIEPIVVGGMTVNISGFHLHEPVQDGIEKFARRAAKWLALRRKPERDKKLAIVYYNKSLGKDDLMRGSPTGAFLDGPESFQRFLPALKSQGYDIRNEPATAAELIERLRTGGRNVGPWAAADLSEMVAKGQPALVPLPRYLEWFNRKLTAANREAVIKAFGPPPGKIMVVERDGQQFLVVPRIDLGNVILVPQPERGEKQDDKLLHTRDTPPPHNYLAFYWWLEEEFGADAIVHWGTHGSLELLPGKEAGLTRDSWSDVCVGDMPVVNLWITDNIAEATLARRRSYAALVDHLPPPALNAGLSERLRNLHDDTAKFRALEAGLLRDQYRKRISSAAREEKIDEILKLPRSSRTYGDADIERIAEYIQHLTEEQTPLTLHILGEPMKRGDQPAYLVSILGKKFLDHLGAVVNAGEGTQSEADRHAALRHEGARLLNAVLFEDAPAPWELTPNLRKDVEFAREIKQRLNDTRQEIRGLIRALDGRYVTPGPGPEPIRNPETAPGGRNLYSLNPEEIPTKPAWDVAVQLVDELLRMRKPKKVGVDLNGMDTMRDFGVMEAQVLYLMGVRPIWDRNNLAIDIELIPRAELKRPRVDVFIAMGGQYKENFPTRVELLDKAVRLVAAANEADNYIREGTLANTRQLIANGMSAEQAAQLAPARIFGTKQGNMSGTNILYLVPRSGVWDKDADVADVYVDNMSWVYTKGAWGQKIDGLYRQAIQGTDTLVRNWSSNMTSQLSNHHAFEYLGGLSMAVKALTGKEAEAFIADVRSADGARMREFGEVLSTSFKTELLNPNWIKGMKEHGYAGAGHAAELVKNTFGWSVTRSGSVSDSTWNEIYSVYVEDRLNLGVREWMEKENPHALQEMTATMLEASRKGYWKADARTIQSLARVYHENVAKYGESNGLVSGGNTALEQFVGEQLNAPGSIPTNSTQAAASAAPAPGPPPSATASLAKRASTVAGQVLAPVSKALRPAAPARQAISLAAMLMLTTISMVVLVTGFIRREGAL